MKQRLKKEQRLEKIKKETYKGNQSNIKDGTFCENN